MKKIVILTAFLFSTLLSSGQGRIRIASVDMEYVLSKLPEYQSALNELNARANRWKIEIERKQNEIKDLKQVLEQEKVLLTKELLEEKQEEIAFKEKELLRYQMAKFGPEGDYILQKEHLVVPVQDRVFNAVSKLLKSAKYDIVFDKSNDKLGLIYTSSQIDISDKILKLISKEKGKEERERKNKDRKDKQKRNLSEAAKKRKALAEKRKKEREEKRKAALEARKKKRDKTLKAQKKSVDKKQNDIKESTPTKEKVVQTSSLNEKNKDSINVSENKLAPKTTKVKEKKLSPQELAEKRKKEREERRKKILEERRKKAEAKKQKNKH